MELQQFCYQYNVSEKRVLDTLEKHFPSINPSKNISSKAIKKIIRLLKISYKKKRNNNLYVLKNWLCKSKDQNDDRTKVFIPIKKEYPAFIRHSREILVPIGGQPGYKIKK